MRARLFIRPGSSDPSTVQWVCMDTGGTVGAPTWGSWQEAALEAPGREVIVFVPGPQVLLTRAAVPSRNRQRVAEAIPFALEEQLIDDVEDLHFALGQRDAAGRISAAVVGRDHMEAWQERLQTAGIRADVLIPDLLAVPYTQGEWTLLQETDVSLLRTGTQAGIGFDTWNARGVLDASLKEEDAARPRCVRVIPCVDGELPDLDGIAEGVSIETEPRPGSALGLLAYSYDPQTAINLLQGPYSRHEQLGKLWRPWRPAAALLMAWLIIQTGVTVGEFIHLKHEERALRRHVEQTFRSALPDVKHIVDAKVQMQRALDALRGGGDPASAGFLKLLSDVGPQLISDRNLQLTRMSFSDGQLDLEVVIGDLQRLDALKQRLAKNSGYSVNIQSATARADGVDARLQIKAKAS